MVSFMMGINGAAMLNVLIPHCRSLGNVLRSTRKLAAQGKGNIRHVIVCQSQQSEYDLRSIPVIAFHRCILPIRCKHKLGEVVCAEAQKVSVLDYLLRRKRCGRSLNHGSQFAVEKISAAGNRVA